LEPTLLSEPLLLLRLSATGNKTYLLHILKQRIILKLFAPVSAKAGDMLGLNAAHLIPIVVHSPA
jgi:hypothetical protein